MSRQRYWYVFTRVYSKYVTPRRRLRSYLGYPPVRDAQPNTTHYALAALQHAGHINKTVTQNVDGLHRKAISHCWDDAHIDAHILELHGTLHVSLMVHAARLEKF
jgi:NAD-dependent deacetylase sirtuin 4